MTTIFEAIKFIENIVDSEKCFGIIVTKFKDGTMRFSYTHTQEHLAEWTDGKIVDGVVTLATANGDTLCQMPLLPSDNRTVPAELAPIEKLSDFRTMMNDYEGMR